MNIREGREKYLDPYSGGQANITINNASNYAAGITYGSIIYVTTGSAPDYDYIVAYWVQEITYSDYPGGTGFNTATITAVDWISRAGRAQITSQSVPQGAVGTQLSLMTASLPADMLYAGTGSSIGSAITYTGTFTNYLNLAQTTERGYVFQRSIECRFIGRNQSAYYIPIATTIGRTSSSTQIAYQNFRRIQNGSQFINTATISSTGIADQTSTNATSVSAYGPAFYSSQTVDYNTTQASNNANWIANNFNDPASLRFECSFSDVAQNSTALSSFMNQLFGPSGNRALNIIYTVPGGTSTTSSVLVEGFTVNVTTQSTEFVLSLSPLQYYQFFTLNSTTLGILNTSRLGW